MSNLASKVLGGLFLAVFVITCMNTEVRAQDSHARCGGTINWTSDNCFTIIPIQACKPEKKWDTQKIHADHYSPYKWVYSLPGWDHVCYLNMDPYPRGETAHDYAKMVVSDRLKAKGFSDVKILNKVMNSRNVAVVSGRDIEGKSDLTGWFWRNKKVGVSLQCFCGGGNCNSGTSENFQRFADSFRFVSEEGCIENR